MAVPQGAIGSAANGGYIFPADFSGPLPPNSYRVGQQPNYSSPSGQMYVAPGTTNPQQPSTNTNSGGGGGSTSNSGLDPHINPATGAWDDNYYAQQQKNSQGDMGAQIDALYGPSYDYLNQAESALRADLPNALSAAQSNYDLNASQLGNTKSTANQGLDTQLGKATSGYENALADARRMYQEQQQGAIQRFGGSSSAGQAFSEIQSREQARQFGQTGRQYADVQNQIETQRQGVEKEYQNGLLQLQVQKQTAIDQANRDFQNKLLQISQSRAQLGQAKAEARLGALQDLRNQVFAIEQQNKQFEQTLALQRQQAQLQLGNFSGITNNATSQASSIASNYNPSITAPYSPASGLGTQTTQQQYIGNIGGNPKDPLSRYLA